MSAYSGATSAAEVLLEILASGQLTVPHRSFQFSLTDAGDFTLVNDDDGPRVVDGLNDPRGAVLKATHAQWTRI